MIDVSRLSIRYPRSDRWLPHNLSLTVAAGELVVITGPSGCGKSTLALALNGSIPHLVSAEIEGEVRVAGVSTVDSTVPELATNLSVVFQDPDSQVVMGTVWDEVCFGPENLALPLDEVAARAERALSSVGLWERRHDAPESLSGGNRQRLVIASALAMQSPAIVLDEPTSNLDAVTQREIYAILGTLARDGHAVVAIDHNIDAALPYAQRIIVLNHEGENVYDGPVEGVRHHWDTLVELGVWLPAPTTAALQLRQREIVIDPLPLTSSELIDGLRPHKPHASASERTPSRETAITLSDISITRGGREVIHNLSATIHSGEFVAVIGGNGAGKTSLLLAIAGIVKAPKGSVDVLGVDPSRTRRGNINRRVGFVFQNPEHQFVTTSVLEEVRLSLRSSGLSADEQSQKTDELLSRLHLSEFAQRHPFQLSGGQKRRLSVATALASSAGILVLDEPTFGQDYELADQLAELLETLNRSGVTIVLATHDLQLVADYSDRVLLLEDGRLIADSTFDGIRRSGALVEAGLGEPPLARALDELPAWSGLSSVRRMQ